LNLISFGDELVKGDAAPKYLAESLGYNFCDVAEIDTCNNQIFRKVIEYSLEDNINNFFLIGWTNTKRREVWWKDKIFTYRPELREYNDNGINSLHNFDDVIFNDLLLSQHWATEAFLVQQVLKKANIKYYMYNTQDCILFNDKTLGVLKAINARKYHNPLNKDSSMKYFLEKEKYSTLDESAHIRWSEFLEQKITAGFVL